MAAFGIFRASRGAQGRRSIARAAALAALLIPFLAAPAALGAEEAASPDAACLGCHGTAGMEKTLGDGAVLKLYVPGDAFAKSVHGGNGCTSCHSDVDLGSHPPQNKTIASARSFSVASSQICKTCHTDKFDEWQKSIHGTLVASGNARAPVCTNCHNPHAVMKGAQAKIEQVACKNCHTDIFNAYLGSVHAKSRQASADSYAPLCSGCHSAHAVQPTSFGAGPTAACSNCHADLESKHAAWLPNAALHFKVVSCPACHVPNAQRKVDLMLIDQHDKAAATEQIGVPLFEASLKSDGKGIDAPTLWNLLQALNRGDAANKTKLRGRLTVLTGPQAHQLADKTKAISDCGTCHRKGSDAFKSVSISLVDAEGRRVGYGANADVLNSPMSLGTVSGFYAIGGTRIGVLDILLVLATLAGLAVPVGHLGLGWLLKRYGIAHGPHASGGDGHDKA